MKPDGRALDIAAIGLGQAGGNLAAEFFRRGYRAVALNTAETDLAALEPGGLVPTLPPDRRLYIGLDGYDGAGADPGYGRDCIRAHADRIKALAHKIGQDADAVVVCAGLGGGTGSAVATLVEILDDDELPLVGMMTLPTESESGLAKVNAVRSVNEVVESSLLGWIFVDNGRLSALNSNVSVAAYYDHVNSLVIEPLDALNRLNARPNVRSIRSFDGEDFRKLLLSGGVLNYATSKIESLATEEVVGAVQQNIESSALMPGGFDISRISYLGLILEAPATVLADTSIAAFEEIHDALKAATGGAAIYQGVYRLDDEGPTTLRLVAVTQSLPRRIRELLGDAKREGQVIGEKAQEDLVSLELGDVQKLDLFRTHARATERPRRARGSGRRAAPRPLDGLPDEIGPGAGRRILRTAPDASAAGAFRRPPLRTPDSPPPSPITSPAEPARPRLPDLATEAQGPIAFDDSARPARRRVGRRRPGAGRGPKASGPSADSVATDGSLYASVDIEDDAGTASPLPLGGEHGFEPRGLQALADAEPELDEVEPDESLAADPELGREARELVDELESMQRVAIDDLKETFAAFDRPPAADPDADTGDLPSPAIYDKLVVEFQEATDAELRRQLQRRLEGDSLSSNSVVRYYAVEAMSKLGRSIFGNALLAATEDEDEAVRNLAVQALKG